MYKFAIGNKELSFGKLKASDPNILDFSDQSKEIQISGVELLSVDIEQPFKRLVRNNALNHWSFKEELGRILLHLCISATSDDEKNAAIKKLRGMLDGSTLIQVKENGKDTYYKAELLFGTIDENINTDSINVIYSFKKNDCGEGIYPLAPSNVRLRPDPQNKNVTILFKKGANATGTKVVCDGNEEVTDAESITVALNEYGKKYAIDLISLSETGLQGAAKTVYVSIAKPKIVPLIPENVVIESIVGKSITLSFTKGANAEITQVVLNDSVYETFDNHITILAPDYDTEYEVKLRSVSSDGAYSEYTDAITVTTGSVIIPSMPVINSVSINGKVVTILFSKAENAVYTEFLVDGKSYSTQDTCLTVEIDSYHKEFTYKARSISATENYSDYTEETTAKTKGISLSAPSNLSVAVIGTVAVFSFVKALNSLKTELVVDGTSYEIDGEDQEVIFTECNKEFTYKARSIADKDTIYDDSDYTEIFTGTTGDFVSIIPSKPTELSVSVLGKKATFTFVKGENAVATELVIDGTTHLIEETSYTHSFAESNKEFKYKARSVSSTGNYSHYTEELVGTTQEPVIPSEPSNILCSISGKVVTINFSKGENAVTTVFEITKDDVVTKYSTESSSLELELEYESTYLYKAYSVSATGDISISSETGTFTTGTAPIIPSVPTGISHYANGKVITISFTKGINAESTEIIFDGQSYVTTDSSYEITVDDYETDYEYKLRSISSTGDYSDYSEVLTATSGLGPVLQPTNIVATINGTKVTFTFTKASNAISTEFVVDDTIYTTESDSLTVSLGVANKTFTYKARSISVDNRYSEYTEECSATTDIDTVIPEGAPTDYSIITSGRAGKITFTKNVNAVSTEVLIDGATFSSTGNEIDFYVSNFDTDYVLKIRSAFEDGTYSDYASVKFSSEEKILNARLNTPNNNNYYGIGAQYVPYTFNTINYQVNINIEALKNKNANRYSINASLVNGKLN